MTEVLPDALPVSDLARLHSESIFVAAEANLAQIRAEDARHDYQRGRLALPALMEFERSHSAALALLDAHKAAVVDLEQRQAEQLKAERIAALRMALRLNRDTRVEAMSVVLTELEDAELELHAARQEARRVRQVVESALFDAGRQDAAQLAALEGRPSPAVAALKTLEEMQFYDEWLDSWLLSSGDSISVMDDSSLTTARDAANVDFEHCTRWSEAQRQLAQLRGRILT